MRTLLPALAFATVCLAACGTNQTSENKKEDTSTTKKLDGEDLAKRGGYLVLVGGCNDCHSPKVMTPQGPMIDTTKVLSGHPDGSPLPPLDANAGKPGHWYYAAPDLTAWVGPWGISYTYNLTPDSTTGLGTWTADMFVKTIRTGRHMGLDNGRPILPPMPWQEMAKMTDEDLKAIFAYLQTLPPVKNKIQAPTPPNQLSKR
jgi:mono/diheme cytochrome c family protein